MQLSTYEALRSEIMLCAEAVGDAPKHPKNDPGAMDVGSFRGEVSQAVEKEITEGHNLAAGKATSKAVVKPVAAASKTSRTKTCHICGKKGHTKQECRWKGQPEKAPKKGDTGLVENRFLIFEISKKAKLGLPRTDF